MYGPTVKRKHAIFNAAVRWGVGYASAGMAACTTAVLMVSAISRSASGAPVPGPLVIALAGVAIAAGAFVIFAVPSLVERSLATGGATTRWPAEFAEAIASGDASDRIAARLGMTALLQLGASFLPSVCGVIAFLGGSGTQVYSVFLGLAIVVMAAVFPRLRDWDDAIVSEGAAGSASRASAESEAV